MATLQNRNGSYRVLFVYRGKRETFTLGRVSKTLAEAKVAKVDEILAMLAGGYITLPTGMLVTDFVRADGRPPEAGSDSKPQSPTGSVTLARLRDEYLQTHRAALEANTLAGIEIHFRHLITTFGERFPLTDISLAALQKHADRRAKMKGARGPLSPVTVRKDFVTLRAAWNWAMGMGFVSEPFPALKRIKLSKTEEKPPFQTRAEIERRIALGGLSPQEIGELWECLYLRPEEVSELLDYVREHGTQPWVHPMVCTAAHTGARRSELLRMEVSDVDPNGSGDIIIRERKRIHGSRTTRRVPLTPFLKDVLVNWLSVRPRSKFLFVPSDVVARSKKRSRTTGHKGEKTRPSSHKEREAGVRMRATPEVGQLTHDEASDHFDRTLAGSKWEVVRGWHVLRHSFISACANKGIDQRIIDNWVGHATEEQRRRYRHLYPNTQQEAIRSVFG